MCTKINIYKILTVKFSCLCGYYNCKICDHMIIRNYLFYVIYKYFRIIIYIILYQILYDSLLSI